MSRVPLAEAVREAIAYVVVAADMKLSAIKADIMAGKASEAGAAKRLPDAVITQMFADALGGLGYVIVPIESVAS